MSDSLQGVSIEKVPITASQSSKSFATPNTNGGMDIEIENVDLSSINNSSKSTEKKSSGGSERTKKIQSYIDQQVIDPNENVNSIEEMEEKTKRDLKTLEERVSDAKEKLDSLKKAFEYAKYDISVYTDALPDDEKWIESYGMTKKEYQDMIDKMSDYVGMLNQTIKSDKELLKKMPYLKKMDTKDFSDYVSNYKSNWQDFVNYDEVAEQYSYGHNLKTYTKLNGKSVDWISVIEYMLAKDKNLVIGEHDELRASYLKYEAMDESQRMMYHYLFEKEGVDSAQKYLDAIADDINKNTARNRVERRIKSMAKSYVLDKDGHIVQASIDATLENLIGSYGSGFEDAIKGNYTGLFKFDKDNYTEEEYEQMFMLQYLNQNGMLKGAYDSGSVGGTVSNMFMSMIMYTGATYLSGGTALAGIVPYLYQAGSIATSVANTGGNARHYALVNGSSEEEADQYSSSIMKNNLFTQVTSAVVSRGIGATSQYSSIINGSNTLSFPTNVAISAANTVVGASTATWEVSQEQELRSALLHEKPLDLSTATDQMVETFVSNIIMGGLSEVPGLALCKYSIQWDGKVFEFDTDDCLAFFRDNPDATAQDFVDAYSGRAVVDPKTGKIFDIDRERRKRDFKKVLPIFSNVVGDWSPSDDTSDVLYDNLLKASSSAGVSQDQLENSMKTLDTVMKYYLDAKGLQGTIQSGGNVFETYRTHGIVHVLDVLTKSVDSINAFESAGIKNLDIDSVMLAAVMHDTGMSGGKQLTLDVDGNGNLKIGTMDVQMDCGNIRESHAFQSGVNVIAEYDTLKKNGYSDAQIAEAALLAFAHSKSNSGLNPLSSNPAGWSFAIQALQEASADSGFDFVGALKDAGIITDIHTKGSATVTVKAPKKYKTIDGKLVDADGKVVGTKGAGKPVVDDDYNPNDDKSFKGNVGVYEFADGVLDKLSYEALALRIGDALTNNDNAKTNQYGGNIIIDNEVTNYKNQSNTESVLQVMLNRDKDALPAGTTVDNIVDKLRTIEDGLANAASAETKHDKIENSVVFAIEKDGKREIYNNSQQFVLGENNQTYSIRGGSAGVEVVISVKDTEAVPFCTLFAIEERAGELTSKGTNIMTKSAPDGTTLTMVIEIDKNASESYKSLYRQYSESYAKNKAIKVKIVEK